jgi:hypothetical protein
VTAPHYSDEHDGHAERAAAILARHGVPATTRQLARELGLSTEAARARMWSCVLRGLVAPAGRDCWVALRHVRPAPAPEPPDDLALVESLLPGTVEGLARRSRLSVERVREALALGEDCGTVRRVEYGWAAR